MAIEVGYSVSELNDRFKELQQQLKNTNKELTVTKQALGLDPKNINLVNDKFEVMEKQLSNNQEQSLLLSLKIKDLNEEIANSTGNTDLLNKELAQAEQQYKNTNTTIEGLTGALSEENKAKELSKAKWGDLNKALKDAQISMRAMNGLTTGVSDAFKIWGIDISNTNKEADILSKTFETLMGGMQMISGILPQLIKLTDANTSSFQKLAIGATLAFSAFQITDGILNQFDGTAKVVAGAITALVAVLVAGTIAWMAYQGTMTMGVAVPIILAAVGAGIAGIKAMIPSESSDVGGTTSTPSIPSTGGSNSSSGSSNYQTPSQVAPANFSYEAFEAATFRAIMKASEYIKQTVVVQLNQQEIARATVNESVRTGGQASI